MWDKNVPIVQIYDKFESSERERLFQEWAVVRLVHCTQYDFYKSKVISDKEITTQKGSWCTSFKMASKWPLVLEYTKNIQEHF